VPAVHIEGNDLGGRTIQIWGSNPDEVNVYVDGVLINMLGIKNQADISIIPLDKVSKIDVHKGANLTLLGQGAFGGVVNIKTEDNQNTGLTLKSKIGSYDSKFLIGQLNFSLWNKLILSYSGQYSTMKPEIEYFPGEKFAPKSFNDKIESEKQNHFLGISYFGKTGKISGKIINYNFKYNKPDWEDKNNNYLFSLAFNGNIGHFKNFDIYLNHFYNQEKTKRNINDLSSFTTNFYSNRTNLKLAKKIELTKNNHLQLLTEYFHDELNTNLYAHNAGFNMLLRKTSIYDNRAAIGGTFTFTDQHEKYPFINWNTFIGVREDFIASGEKEFTKSIGGEVNFDRSDYYSSFYFNYGSNVKFPTLLEKSYIENYEIITPSLDTPSQDTLSQKIKPEYINSYQFGIKNEYKNKNGSFNSIDMGLTFFHNTIFNKLLKRPFDTYIIQTQMGRNITKGFEASIRMNELYKYFTISGSYLKTDISNKTLYAFKPEQKVTFQLDLFSMQDFSVSGRYFYEGKSYGWYYDIFDQVQTEEILPFYDFDVAINYRHKFNHLMIEAQLTGSNILDSAEFSYYYLKKRYWQFSLAIGI
ncbi:MAG: TonB-dependent receptor plug domain-containing protein, partial [Calditrichia bacterium]|nr:TonB-dependent receptor plug domain-containing protein [Calditrichia bacterium]